MKLLLHFNCIDPSQYPTHNLGERSHWFSSTPNVVTLGNNTGEDGVIRKRNPWNGFCQSPLLLVIAKKKKAINCCSVVDRAKQKDQKLLPCGHASDFIICIFVI